MSTFDHGHWDDEVAAYALGALDGDEAAAFEEHLDGCAHCQAELRWLAPAVDALPASVEQLAPPPSLRKRILGEAESTAPTRARTPRRRSWWPANLSPGLAVAATIALVLGISAGYALRGGDQGVQTTTVALEASTPAIQADAALVQHGDTWTLDVEDMPDLHGGDVYQVWIGHGKRIDPSVLFVPSRGNRAKVALPREVATADQLMVTRERSGGSQEPTSAPMLSAVLQ